MKQHCPVPAQPRSTPTLASIDIFFSFPRCVFVFVWMTLRRTSFSGKCTTTLASQPCHHPSIKRLARHTRTHTHEYTNVPCCGMVKYAEITPCLLFSGTQWGHGWKQVEGLKKLNARWGCAAFPRTGGGWGCHLGEQEGVPRRCGKAEGKEESDG